MHPPWVSKLRACYNDSSVPTEKWGGASPRKSWPHGPEALPFGSKHQRAEREGELGTMSVLYLKSCVMQTGPSVLVFGKSGIIGTANIYTESHRISVYAVIPPCVQRPPNEYLGWARPVFEVKKQTKNMWNKHNQNSRKRVWHARHCSRNCKRIHSCSLPRK